MSAPRLRPEAAPGWLDPLVSACAGLGEDDVPFRRRGPEPGPQAAVLALFSEGASGPDLVLTERAAEMRAHAGQAAFPGGRRDPGDADLVDTAVREAQEEVGLDPADVVALATLPALTIPGTGSVTPVLALEDPPRPLGVRDPGEVAAVVRIGIDELTDPAVRFTVTGPSGYSGPAFAVGGLLVWGFTAGVVDWILTLGRWSRPWDVDDVRDLDDVWRRRHELSAPRPAAGREGGTP